MTLTEVEPRRQIAKATLPAPRLRHCPVGHTVRIIGDPKLRTIIRKDDHYAHFAGDDKASLCCQVDETGMTFGDGAGWRPKLIPTISG